MHLRLQAARALRHVAEDALDGRALPLHEAEPLAAPSLEIVLAVEAMEAERHAQPEAACRVGRPAASSPRRPRERVGQEALARELRGLARRGKRGAEAGEHGGEVDVLDAAHAARARARGKAWGAVWRGER